MEENSIPYEDAVNRLRQLARTNWEIGEIADRVEPKYAEQTLQRLAKESGVEYELLRRCRDVFRAWPESAKRIADLSWSVHMIFAAQPDRFDLIQQRRGDAAYGGGWTAQEARREVQRRRQESWLQAIQSAFARRLAGLPPGSTMPPQTTWETDPIYDFEGEQEDGFEVVWRREDDAEEDEDDAPDPWLFTKGNKKVGDNVFLWNVPVVDCCPGATLSCVANCYANNDNYRRPTVKSRHAWNRQAAEADNFCERAIVELRQRSPSEVRIHSAGDFYSPEYVRKWLAITAALPAITFWYYTRSWRVPAILPELVRLASLSNVRAWFSCDRDTGLPDAVPNVRACWLQIEDEEPPAPAPGQMAIDAESVAFRTKREGREPAKRIGLATVCPTYNGLPAAAGVTCETCRFCFR